MSKVPPLNVQQHAAWASTLSSGGPAFTSNTNPPGICSLDSYVDDFHKLMKKYPKAAAQFGLTDMSKAGKKPGKRPSSDARFACCDFPDLTPDTDADCITLCQL